MKTRICLPIIKADEEEVKKEITDHLDNFDMFEVWIDYLANPHNIKGIVTNLPKNIQERIIVVFRRQEGLPIRLSLEQRMEIITFLAKTKVFMDMDIEKQKEDLEKIKEQNMQASFILSFHDYNKTPRTSALMNIIEDMEQFHPKIYKIATFCKDPKDALHLMHLLLDLKKQNKKAIVLGMGPIGKVTRIFGALYGNEITFAPDTLEEMSAPHQLTRTELEKIIFILERSESKDS